MIEFEQRGEFDFRSDEYEQLFAQSSATAFQHPIWLDRVYAQLVAPSGAEPLIVAGRTRADQKLKVVFPLIRRGLGPVATVDYADMGVSDYNAPIVDRSLEPKLGGQPNIVGLLRHAIRPAVVGRLQKMRGDTLESLGLRQILPSDFMGFHSHEVQLHGPYSAWRKDALSKSFVRFLDRKGRALAKMGAVEFKELTDAESIGDVFSALKSFREGRLPDDPLKNERYFNFYRDVAVEGCRSGFARTQLLTCGGKDAAIIFGLSHGGRFHLLLTGFNFPAFRNVSAGKLIMEHSIEAAIDRGETVYDFTIGDEAYKTEFGTQALPMYTAWIGPGPLAVLASAASGALAELKRIKRTRSLKKRT